MIVISDSFNFNIDKKKVIIKLIISFIVIVVFFIILYFIFEALGLLNLSKEKLQEKIKSYGSLGPIFFIVLSFLQVTFIPIPSTITIIVGSYLFGCLLSFLYSFIGIMTGSMFAFFLGRKIGRPFVNWIIGDKKAVDYYLEKCKDKETVVLFFMFLLPVFPDDALCSLAGITKISYFSFFIMQLITRTIFIIYTIVFFTGEIIPFNALGITIIIVLSIISIILFIICYQKADKINRWLDKIKPNKKKYK